MPEPTPQQPSSVMDNAFMLLMSFHRFGVTKKASLGQVEVNADKNLLRLSKRLLRCAEYDAISAHDREIKHWIQTVAAPFPVRSGAFLIPVDRLEMVTTELQKRADERAALVDAFVAAYPAKVAEIAEESTASDDSQPRALGDLYVATDYPTAEAVKSKFSFEWQFLDYGVPGRLKQLNARLFMQEREKIKTKLAEAGEVMRDAMRAEMADYVAHMAERLTPDEDGKRKIFKESAVKRFTEFLDNFESRNLTNDDELKSLVGQAKNMLAGVDMEMLRKDDAIRSALHTGFESLKDSMDGMVTTRGRKITFAKSDTADETAEVSLESENVYTAVAE